jgi:hypothetical protein
MRCWLSHETVWVKSYGGCHIIQGPSHARVRSRVSSCGTCGGHSDTGTSFSPKYFGFPLSVPFHLCSITRKILIFITGCHNKPQDCGASVASAAGPFTTKKKYPSHDMALAGLSKNHEKYWIRRVCGPSKTYPGPTRYKSERPTTERTRWSVWRVCWAEETWIWDITQRRTD